MIICVPNVLAADELGTIRKELEHAPFVDGATTAGWSAREVKRNQQVDPRSDSHGRMADIMRNAFLRNGLLQAALLPAATTMAMFNRYGTGMQYGPHVDTAVMGGMGSAVRSDIAITLFLSDPESYDGGELVVHTSGMEYEFKLKAGEAIAYPANTLHHVKPVTRGVRQAGIMWVQSLVRDPARRELLWDLESAKRQIFGKEGKTETFDAISRSHANLLRMWADVI
ncbi:MULTISPECIES: Fe2+-dependent dioxygenase [Rhodanobacter]|uniref:PKHD-type hydroxylase n=1 Tax=Rhodanobacter glycinis TaxID=582702 RepID=A0A1I4AMV6_9GAMM|nr:MULTISPECIES: Fe2+-dependent dioxygenase [Rhodanobacter]EIM01039.1 Fe(II)-dependent oxygenase superfamily protein [Rhodanobacter sp. 115]SFK57835.1 PKHD-type hydroxylase [Rhodanobacter glycinis]